MTNNSYIELVNFDNQYSHMSVHKRLSLYVHLYGKHNLNYYLAKLSHEIYKSRGIKGHVGRQHIRDGLKRYAFMKLDTRTIKVKPIVNNTEVKQ